MIDYSRLESIASSDTKGLMRTKDNRFTMLLHGRYVHSFYTCGREAARLVEHILPLERENTLVIFLGAGLGYHIEELEKEGFKNLIIIERDREIFSVFDKIYIRGDNSYVISPDDEPSRLDTIITMLDIEKWKNIKTVSLRGSYERELYKPFEDRIERLLQVKLGDFSTRLKFEEIWLINIIKNIGNLKSSGLVRQLFGKAVNVPVIVVSAGPSLKLSLNEINRFSDKCIVIAVDTALTPLYEAGIIPDFIYSLDSQVHNLNDFSMIGTDYLKRTRLIYDIVVNPELPAYFRGISGSGRINTFTANTAHLDFDFNGNSYLIKNELVNWIESAGSLRIGDIETGGSVSTSAFYFAYQMGGNPIMLTGQDLAYSYFCSHASSTSHFYRIIAGTSRLKSLQDVFMGIMLSRRYIRTDPVNPQRGGGEKPGLYTDFVLKNFRGWFEESAKSIMRFNPEISLVNSSSGGSLIDNFQNIGMTDYFNKNDYHKLDKEKLFDSMLIETGKTDKIISLLAPLHDYLVNLEADRGIFNKIRNSEWKFLDKYFMRENMIFERYGNFDNNNVERKLFRFIKAIEGASRTDAAHEGESNGL
ncbi:MAG: 6-hydroxymethylpterin diphosphokinase MptE-like protein [Brevinematales bacterium]|jgi:hypothetical protein